MEIIKLDNIPAIVERDYLKRRLRLEISAEEMKEFEELIAKAAALTRPKVIYGLGSIEERGDDFVVIDGVRFTSRLLAENLAKVGRVFPFVVSSGMEIEDFAESITDPLPRSLVEGLKELALLAALKAFNEDMTARFSVGKTGIMNPGSVSEWPISEQVPLFKLLGDPEAAIGVKLLPSMMMSPSRAASGIRFETEHDYQNCMLCPRADCPLRRAKFDPAKKKKYTAG